MSRTVVSSTTLRAGASSGGTDSSHLAPVGRAISITPTGEFTGCLTAIEFSNEGLGDSASTGALQRLLEVLAQGYARRNVRSPWFGELAALHKGLKIIE